MKNTNRKDIDERLSRIIWDYDIDPGKLYEAVTGRREKAGPLDGKQIFIRMLERLSWYDLIDILGLEFLKEALTEAVIEKIRFKFLRRKYETARKILHGSPLSFSGWDPEYRKRIKHTLLSNRWYRS